MTSYIKRKVLEFTTETKGLKNDLTEQGKEIENFKEKFATKEDLD